ncbi:MAG: ribose-phosphate pyrophosphokinase-like domain-containing protein, partial [Parasporobacterium sp.]|nr:ribose-phosphate pyrophosphokinase-like domain-containing protein [Parasporobacterium sp.]
MRPDDPQNEYTFDDFIPVGPLKLAPLAGSLEFAKKVNDHLISFRNHDDQLREKRENDPLYADYYKDSYILNFSCPRFGTGEAKCILNESVRGLDIYAMVDVTNYSLTYSVCGQTNHMSPDNHYQDLKRLIGCCQNARRVSVVMPFLYEGRQHKRTRRESLDCALALEELVSMGVHNIV